MTTYDYDQCRVKLMDKILKSEHGKDLTGEQVVGIATELMPTVRHIVQVSLSELAHMITDPVEDVDETMFNAIAARALPAMVEITEDLRPS